MNVCCPFCDKEVVNDPQLAEQLVSCPFCGQEFQMPPFSLEILPPVGLEPPPIVQVDPGYGASTVASQRYQRPRSGSRRRDRDDNLNLTLGLVGSGVLAVGVFCPVIKAPFIGGMNYFANGRGDGVIVLILALISFAFVLAKNYMALWFTGVGALAVLMFTFVSFQLKLQELRADLRGNMFEGMADAISIEFGFPVMIIGAGLIIAAAAIQPKPLNHRH